MAEIATEQLAKTHIQTPHELNDTPVGLYMTSVDPSRLADATSWELNAVRI